MKKFIALLVVAALAVIGGATLAASQDKAPTHAPPTKGLVKVVGPDGKTLKGPNGEDITVDLGKRTKLPTNPSEISEEDRNKKKGEAVPEADKHPKK